MSPKLGAIIDLIPFDFKAVTAFSLDEPQPQLISATKIFPFLNCSKLNEKLFSVPSTLNLRSWNK